MADGKSKSSAQDGKSQSWADQDQEPESDREFVNQQALEFRKSIEADPETMKQITEFFAPDKFSHGTGEEARPPSAPSPTFTLSHEEEDELSEHLGKTALHQKPHSKATSSSLPQNQDENHDSVGSGDISTVTGDPSVHSRSQPSQLESNLSTAPALQKIPPRDPKKDFQANPSEKPPAQPLSLPSSQPPPGDSLPASSLQHSPQAPLESRTEKPALEGWDSGWDADIPVLEEDELPMVTFGAAEAEPTVDHIHLLPITMKEMKVSRTGGGFVETYFLRPTPQELATFNKVIAVYLDDSRNVSLSREESLELVTAAFSGFSTFGARLDEYDFNTEDDNLFDIHGTISQWLVPYEASLLRKPTGPVDRHGPDRGPYPRQPLTRALLKNLGDWVNDCVEKDLLDRALSKEEIQTDPFANACKRALKELRTLVGSQTPQRLLLDPFPVKIGQIRCPWHAPPKVTSDSRPLNIYHAFADGAKPQLVEVTRDRGWIPKLAPLIDLLELTRWGVKAVSVDPPSFDLWVVGRGSNHCDDILGAMAQQVLRLVHTNARFAKISIAAQSDDYVRVCRVSTDSPSNAHGGGGSSDALSFRA